MTAIFNQLLFRWLKCKIYAPVILALCYFTLFSCTQHKDRKPIAVGHLKDTIPSKTGRIKQNKTSIDSATAYTNDLPKITPLPFGPKVGLNRLHTASKFYEELIYANVGQLIKEGWTAKTLQRIKIYKLPIVKKINYIKVSSVDSDKCDNGKPFGDFLKVNSYRYRLPNINNYECYYMCDYDYSNKGYTEQIKQNCQSCLFMFYGYLIIYNPKNSEATVVTIFYNTYRDGSDQSRNFYIDKNYTIHLVDFSQESDDGDGSVASSITINNKYILSISQSGEVVFNKTP